MRTVNRSHEKSSSTSSHDPSAGASLLWVRSCGCLAAVAVRANASPTRTPEPGHLSRVRRRRRGAPSLLTRSASPGPQARGLRRRWPEATRAPSRGSSARPSLAARRRRAPRPDARRVRAASTLREPAVAARAPATDQRRRPASARALRPSPLRASRGTTPRQMAGAARAPGSRR